jgi:hypothetical protein
VSTAEVCGGLRKCCTWFQDPFICSSSWFYFLLSFFIALDNKTCADVPPELCPRSLCSLSPDGRCQDCLFLSLFLCDLSAAVAEECACTQTGLSGNASTGVVGCRRHPSFPDGGTSHVKFCYVNGGAAAKCPCSKPSTHFPGASYRACQNSLWFITLASFDPFFKAKNTLL